MTDPTTPGWESAHLSVGQAALLRDWLGEPDLVADLSWGQTDTRVLHVREGEHDLIVKAGGSANHHLLREIDAHRSWTRPLVSAGTAARMHHACERERILVLDHLPGALVEGGPAEADEDTYAQAGTILRALHVQESRVDTEYESRATGRALAWLDGAHRIRSDHESAARAILRADDAPAVRVVPTHGDWQPRNWLAHAGTIRVIDFGRFAFRPPASDLCRLAVQQWRGNPRREDAFLRGYGEDPRDRRRWRIELLREAIGTAAWAYQVDDMEFETQGHEMLADALERF